MAAACILLSPFVLRGQHTEEPARPLESASSDFRSKIHQYAQSGFWQADEHKAPVDRRTLVLAVEAARAYYLNHQKAEGNFVYSRDILSGEVEDDDNQVRQAGALWGLSALNRDRPTNDTRSAVVRGLDFFFRCTQPLAMGHSAPVYPDDDSVKSGTVALVCLAITELWRGQEPYLTDLARGLYDTWLTTYLEYLRAMEMENGSWGKEYYVKSNQRLPQASPYYDGECLLAYCKAARYMGRNDLIPKIEKIAPLLAERYTLDTWKEDIDSEATKGFFQWGCMAFAEYVQAGWKNADTIGDAALALAWWQLHEHRVLLRRGNTAYSLEGLLAAWQVAEIRHDSVAMQEIRDAIEDILSTLLTWQVGGPLQKYNSFLNTLLRIDPIATGGIMNAADSGVIRIDVVQHQVNAMLMALNLLYPEK